MHRALILTSHYGPDSGYPNRPDWPQTEHLSASLADCGYTVETLASGTGLIEALRQKLRDQEPHVSLLVYFVGYVALADNREPTLLLADKDAAALRLSQLATRAGSSFGRVLFILDGTLGCPTEQVPQVDGQSAEATTCALLLDSVQSDNVGALISVRPWSAAPERSFTDSVLHLLDDAARRGASADSVELMHSLDASPIADHHVGLSETDPNFIILRQRKFPSNPALNVPSAGETAGALSSDAASADSQVREKAIDAERVSVSNFPDRISVEDAVGALAEELAEPVEPSPEIQSSTGSEKDAASGEVLAPPPGSAKAFAAPVSWRAPAAAAVEPEDEAALLKRAKLAWEQKDGEAAIETARRCLQLFPNSVAALRMTANLLADLERWDELAGVYEQLLQTTLGVETQVKLQVALSRIYASKLDSAELAWRSIEQASELRPKDACLHLEAAALCEVTRKVKVAEAHYRAALTLEPLAARSYRRATAFFSWSNDLDAAWNTAAILNYLGEASEQETALVQSRRVQTLPQLGRPLVESDFLLGLTASATDPGLTQLWLLLAGPVKELTRSAAKQSQQLLPSLTQENVAGSTTTLARTLAWAATLIGVDPPALFLTDQPDKFSPLPLDEPTWVVSRSFGRGKSPQELVFYWAKSLSQLRPDGEVLRRMPSRDELLALLESCYSVVGSHPAEFDDAKRLSKALAKALSRTETEALRVKLSSLPFAKLETRLDAWLAERTKAANRIGLLACGDPELAARALLNFSEACEKADTRQLEDLFGFAVSDSYARLRQMLGVSLNQPAAAE